MFSLLKMSITAETLGEICLLSELPFFYLQHIIRVRVEGTRKSGNLVGVGTSDRRQEIYLKILKF